MLVFAYYTIKVIICSAVLFGYYWFFLRNKLFHSYNRFYLLATIVLSLTLPLMKFNVWQETGTPKNTVVKMLQVVNSSDDYMDEIIIQSHYNHISKEQIAGWIFIGICVVFATLMVKGLAKIYSLKRNNPSQQYEGIALINTNDRKTPFSFFKNIFWNNEIDINSSNGKRILKHEVAHVQEKHSHDKLFVNIILIFFWSNPVFWFIRKELNMIHEFIADKRAVENGDTAAFAAMILQSAYPSQQFELTNNFFYSPIKRRLSMLTKNKTKVSYISRLLVLPLAVVVFAAFTLKAKTYMASLPKEKTTTVVIDAGHGGNDNGAIATDGTNEKDLTLALARSIKEFNKAENIRILLTRETDIYQDPKSKAALAKKLGAELFISIHVDNSPTTADEQSGLTTWIPQNESPYAEASKVFGASITAAFSNNYQLRVASNPMQRSRRITVLAESPCPAVLIEAGFISNKKDLAYLNSAEGKEQFAKNILAAIVSYENSIGQNKTGASTINKTSQNETASSSPQDSVPAFKPVLDKLKKDMFIDASQLVALNTNDDNFFKITKLRLNDQSPQPLVIINGKESNIKIVNNLDLSQVDYVRVLMPETAIPVYGQKAMQGALILNTKTGAQLGKHLNEFDLDYHAFSVGDLSGTFVTPAEFKKQSGVSVRKGFTFTSAIVYFGGKGFNETAVATLHNNSLAPVKAFMDKCVSGTSVTFDDIKVADDKGNILFIQSKTYLLEDDTRDIHEPTINMSGINRSAISIDQLPNIKELNCSDANYKITSATVYFSEAGFPDVVATQINGPSLNNIETYMQKLTNGSRITFDNVVIAKNDGTGSKTIDGRSFTFYDNSITNIAQDTAPEKIFVKVQQEPEFPGGKDAWAGYLRKNLDPASPINEGWKPGTYKVIVQFIVDKDGSLRDITTTNYQNSKTAKQCIELIKKGPKWIPAMQNGKNVSAYRKQPITFVVSEG